MAHVVVVGNEKGGAGKSTVAMHLATALARLGHAVAAVDLDLRQRSMGRYIENRARFLDREGLALPSPREVALAAGDDDAARLGETLAAVGEGFVVVDCPGSHTALAQAAHARADTLVTPLNDSFVDFDLLARIDHDGAKILGPSVYAEMVWAARQDRARLGRPAIDWVVVRNRVGAQAMRNKERMERAVDRLSRRIGFRVAPGFAERVVFRELFPRGLTLLDLRDAGIGSFSMSHVAARQELRELLRALRLPGVDARV